MTERDGQPPRTDTQGYARAEAELQRTGQVDYGNWVSTALMRTLFIASGTLLLLLALLLITWANLIVLTIVGALCLLALLLTGYLELCRRRFAFDGGGLMGIMHQLVIDNLDWDGHGELIDIGCGAGALTIRCAKTFPDSRFTGIDRWGSKRSYVREQCEHNARAENVSDCVTFVDGDAARLDVPDGGFDAAVSSFVFHEVRSEPDKRALVREALRVVRPGGAFSFQDMFDHRRLYGDVEAFVQELRDGGVAQIEYIPHTESVAGAPAWIRAPWMLRGAGIIHGRK